MSLTKNLLIHQRIKTSFYKAKVVKSMVEKIISLAKSNTLAARRQAFKILNSHRLVSLLFNEIGPRFVNRTAGFTRIINLGSRRGDNAKIAILELTEIKKEVKKPKKEKEAKPEEKKEEKPEITHALPIEEPKVKPEVAIKERPPDVLKPTKKFLGGLRRIFKKERDSL